MFQLASIGRLRAQASNCARPCSAAPTRSLAHPYPPRQDQTYLKENQDIELVLGPTRSRRSGQACVAGRPGPRSPEGDALPELCRETGPFLLRQHSGADLVPEDEAVE